MRFSPFVICATAVATCNATIQTIISRMQVVEGNLRTLNDSLNALYPSQATTAIQALRVSSQEAQIKKSISAVVAALKSTPSLNVSDSKLLVQEADMHADMIQSMLKNMIAHKPAFETAILYVGDLTKTVHGSMIRGKAKAEEFAEAAQEKVAPGFEIPETRVVGSWDEAIAAFAEGCEGSVCLPDLGPSMRRIRGLIEGSVGRVEGKDL